MNIDIIDSLEGMEALRPEWLALWRACPAATPFQSPQWLIPWTRYLFGGGTILICAIREADLLIGFAPLFVWGTDSRTVSFLGAGISDYGDLLFAPGREAECVSAVWQALMTRRDEWDVSDLQELRSGSGMLQGQCAEECSVCPVLELSTYPGSMDDKHRTDVRRARNKLAKMPDLRFSMADETSIPADLNEFFRLHELRWGALSDSLQRFHREAAAGFLATGNLKLALLRNGSVAMAAIYAFTSGKTIFCYLSGFDPDMAKLSPGAVLLGWVIENAVADGMQKVDFLRHSEGYKYLWGARNRINYALRTGGNLTDGSASITLCLGDI